MEQPQKKEEIQANLVLLRNLAGCLMRDVGKRLEAAEEPFEYYALQLRARLQLDTKDFNDHFVQGYEVLRRTLIDLFETDNSSDSKEV